MGIGGDDGELERARPPPGRSRRRRRVRGAGRAGGGRRRRTAGDGGRERRADQRGGEKSQSSTHSSSADPRAKSGTGWPPAPGSPIGSPGGRRRQPRTAGTARPAAPDAGRYRRHGGEMRLLRRVERHELVDPLQQVGERAVGPRTTQAGAPALPDELDQPVDQDPLLGARDLRQPRLEQAGVEKDPSQSAVEHLVEARQRRVAAMEVDQARRARRLEQRRITRSASGRGGAERVEGRRRSARRTARGSPRSRRARQALAQRLRAGRASRIEGVEQHGERPPLPVRRHRRATAPGVVRLRAARAGSRDPRAPSPPPGSGSGDGSRAGRAVSSSTPSGSPPRTLRSPKRAIASRRMRIVRSSSVTGSAPLSQRLARGFAAPAGRASSSVRKNSSRSSASTHDRRERGRLVDAGRELAVGLADGEQVPLADPVAVGLGDVEPALVPIRTSGAG